MRRIMLAPLIPLCAAFGSCQSQGPSQPTTAAAPAAPAEQAATPAPLASKP